MKKNVLMFMGLLMTFISCNKNDDGPNINNNESQEEQVTPTNAITDFPSQNFMWQAMNAFYFWQDDVADLADDRFDSEESYIEFLASEEDPAAFFYQICNDHVRLVGKDLAVDRFSVAVENYKDLINGLQNISRNNGVEFQLYSFNDSDNLYGVVTYIANESDASTKDIRRGDIFVGVNGQTLNRNNYIDLLFGEEDSYSLVMAQIENGTISENGKEVPLTKVVDFPENPILINRVIEQNGIKIGYLMYNGFLAAYDEELNAVFGTFKSEGITELILDFRYNGGGRVSTAVQIASSIYGTNTNDLFLRARYNDKIQSGLTAAQVETKFSDTTIDGTPINALNLQRVHVITTEATASASELVINGLAPYVNVVQIGETTSGKNEFSLMWVDDRENSFFYDEEREENINPNNQWGILPLLGRNENADGFSDFTSGLVPRFALSEDITNLGTLGDPSEPLLALALSNITGESSKINLTPVMTPRSFVTSYQFKGNNNVSLMDGLLKMDIDEINQKNFN